MQAWSFHMALNDLWQILSRLETGPFGNKQARLRPAEWFVLLSDLPVTSFNPLLELSSVSIFTNDSLSLSLISFCQCWNPDLVFFVCLFGLWEDWVSLWVLSVFPALQIESTYSICLCTSIKYEQVGQQFPHSWLLQHIGGEWMNLLVFPSCCISEVLDGCNV